MTDTPDLPPWDSPERAAKRPDWRSLRHAVKLETPWIRVEQHDTVAPTGNPANYGIIRFVNRAIAILPLHDDGTVSLVGQQRFPLGRYSWELPEGGVPFDEDCLDGAKRELREEAGLEAAQWREILAFDMSNSVTDEVAVCYLATDLSAAETEPDETEAFDYARVPFRQLLEAVIKGQVRDGLTVVCVLRVYHMAASGTLSPELAAHIV